MSKRVMVVDDSRVSELLMEKLLMDSDYQVVCYCRNGEEALAQYDQAAPDLVTMDIIMPGMDGLETARAMLEEHPEAKIVMVTSLGVEDAYEEARSIGAKGLINKPIERLDLLDLLRRALELPDGAPPVR